jgi:hypothetical protein
VEFVYLEKLGTHSAMAIYDRRTFLLAMKMTFVLADFDATVVDDEAFEAHGSPSSAFTG